MGAALFLHVDEFVGFAGGSEQGFLHRLRPAERLNGKAIEVRVGLISNEFDTAAVAKRIDDLFDDLAPRAVTKVGIRKDILSHSAPSYMRLVLARA
jgi:hypothetical protein